MRRQPGQLGSNADPVGDDSQLTERTFRVT
jgi:hypothetical protein